MKTIMEILVKGADYGLEEKQATELTKGLNTILEERELLTEAYKDVITLEITEDNLKTFKELRLQIRDNRTKGIEKWHKTNKAYFLTGGRFVDAIKNKEVAGNERMEAKLMEAEKHFENLEIERIEKLSQERKALILPYEENDTLKDLGHMEASMFESLLLGAKTSHENRIALAKKVEDERIEKEKAERLEREKIAKENEKLKAEAEAQEKKAETERLEREKKQTAGKARQEILSEIKVTLDFEICSDMTESEWTKYFEFENNKFQSEKNRLEIERLKKESEIKKQRDFDAANLHSEKLRREKIEKELQSKKDLEAKHEAEKLANIEAEANKGDSEKVFDLVHDLTTLKDKYIFKSKKNKKMYEDVNQLIDKVINHIK